MENRWRRRARIGAALACVALVGAACSDDDTAETGTDGGEETTTTGGDEPADGETIEVTARDYEFEGMPDTVAAGSTISLTSEEGGEPHEMVVFPYPDGEDRSIDELMELPEAELEGIFAGEPALVTIAMPGTTDTPGPVVGDGSITEPGRYLYICTFPEGTTPESLDAPDGEAPSGPPHFALGMRGEFTVE